MFSATWRLCVRVHWSFFYPTDRVNNVSQVIKHPPPKRRRSRSTPQLTFVAEPTSQSNSFVGTEEYIAPVHEYSSFSFTHEFHISIAAYSCMHIMYRIEYLQKTWFQEIITGAGHSSAIDWWALGNYIECIHDALNQVICSILMITWFWVAGVLIYEMLYGRTPFRGKNRQKTFANILNKDLTFPSSIPVKSYVAHTYMLSSP